MPIIQKPDPLMLSDLLVASRLEIPKYQRSYSWLDQQVEEFLADLFEAFDRNEPWFLGILYTYPNGNLGSAQARMLLDGQQRMTTVFILLKELMLFHENVTDNPALKTRIEVEAAGDLKARIFLPSSSVPRLTLDIANKEKFTEYLAGTNWKSAKINYVAKTDVFAASHKLLSKAVQQIRDRLTTYYTKIGDPNVAFDRFQELVKFVLSNIELIEIEVAGNETIYQIFENINDRGLHLSDSDKFKNLYCSLLQNDEIAGFEQKWFEINKTVHSIDLDLDKDFFFFYYRSIGVDDGGKFYKKLRSEIAIKETKTAKLRALKKTFVEIEDMVKVAKAVIRVKLTDVFAGTPTELQRRVSKVVGVIVNSAWRTSPQFRVLVYTSYFAFNERNQVETFNAFLGNLVNSVRFYTSAAIQKEKGNAIRTYTIDIAKEVGKGMSVANAVRSKDTLNFPGRFVEKRLDLMSFADNKLSSLCLLLTQAHKNVEPIRSHDSDQSWSLEHFVPKKFEDHWDYLAHDNFKKYEGKYNLREPISANDLRQRGKYRIQEFLGNKFYMDLGQNKMGNNNSFVDKKQQYVDYGQPITMPNFKPFKRIDEYSSFGIREILARSNELYDILIAELKNIDLPSLKPK